MNAVDLFAGFGGFTLGAAAAGARVVWAANHWPLAVAVHAANHPATEHACQDLRQADWSALPAFDLLLASPACQGHSMASQPRRRDHHDAMRSTAWAVVDCADVTNPRAIVVENVLAFRRWRLFPTWRSALEQLGYVVREYEVQASRHGVPQRRERLFVVAAKRALPTHIGPRTREQPFEACVEADAEGWRSVGLASVGARARIDRGRVRLGRRFLVQHVTGHSGSPLGEPIRTITTKDHWALVDGDSYRPLTTRELARGMGFPDAYRWPDGLARATVTRGLGNAVPPPLAADVVRVAMEAA